MSIGKLINEYGKDLSPYAESLVNHLPMVQLAYYTMTKDLEKTKTFSEIYMQRLNIDKVKTDYPEAKSIDKCLGKPDMYEACLDLIQDGIKSYSLNQYIYQILNKYEFGMSSGLFHTLIRVAYGVEGVQFDEELISEATRSLAYYITAYKPANIFENGVTSSNAVREINNLIHNPHIKKQVKSQNSLGQRLKTLYKDPTYLKVGFFIDGTEDEKINTLLDVLIPAYENTNDIVVLHCITGLHALMVLKDYYDDFHKALNILTTCIITHLLTIDNLDITRYDKESTLLSWEEIWEKATESTDVHTIKLTYSSRELYKLYKNPGLKDIAIQRINRTK